MRMTRAQAQAAGPEGDQQGERRDVKEAQVWGWDVRQGDESDVPGPTRRPEA